MDTIDEQTPLDLGDRITDLRARASSGDESAAVDAWALLEELEELATTYRDAGVTALDAVFAAGTVPADLDGPTSGTLLVPLVQPLIDWATRAVGSIWMPWHGMHFDRANGRGTNTLGDHARWPAKLLWPRYQTEDADDGRHAFEFVTRVEPSVDNPDLDVLALDFGSVDANPSLLVKHLRDEIVQVVPRVFLGKVMHRHDDEFATVGYIALRPADDVPAPAPPSKDWWRLPSPVALLNLRGRRPTPQQPNAEDPSTDTEEIR